MKRLVVLALVGLMLTGCSGVLLSSDYSALLDESAALAYRDWNDALAGKLDANQMTFRLGASAVFLRQLQYGRDGKVMDPNEAHVLDAKLQASHK